MKFKVLLAIFALLTCVANATDGKYTLTYQGQNKWVANQDIKPLRQAIIFFKANQLKIKATCSNADKFCDQRVQLINHVLKKQGVRQQVSVTETSTYIPTNKIVLNAINLDPNKYTSLFINYADKNLEPVEKSQKDIKKLIKFADLKYLSKFRMYCNKADELCKKRFTKINNLFAKTFTFKYNFALYENTNLTTNQAQLVAHRHDYKVSDIVEKPTITAKQIKQQAKNRQPSKKDYSIVYTKEKNIIAFKENSSKLELLERIKIENLIANSKNNTFRFACGNVSNELCQARVHSIKNYALKNTNNIIIMEQFKHKIYRNYVLIIDKLD